MTRSRSWALLTGRAAADLVRGRFIALGAQAHTERNPDRQNFTKPICFVFYHISLIAGSDIKNTKQGAVVSTLSSH